jgi:RNA polymerase sigma factor (sigma-70 family)
MDERTWLADRFEAHRSHLRAAAYRMLGSLSEADDAVQETWLRLSRSNAAEVENLGGWLTTVVGRVSLDKLRSRRIRGEVQVDSHLPEPIVSRSDARDPEQELLLADSIGLALLVVLEALEPAERISFVLHDMFDLPFEEIAPVVGRTTIATRQLASRARRRVRAASVPDADLARQREVVDAFLAAARGGDFDALVAVLDPDVRLRTDRGAGAAASGVVRGARSVAGRALLFAHRAGRSLPVLVNGTAGIVAFDARGRVASVLGFTVKGGKIVEIDVLADPARLRPLDPADFGA